MIPGSKDLNRRIAARERAVDRQCMEPLEAGNAGLKLDARELKPQEAAARGGEGTEFRPDFSAQARVEYLGERRGLDRFAEAAAARFAARSAEMTYSNGAIDPDLLAIRWGAHGRAVLVCRVDVVPRPVIYADIIPADQPGPHDFLRVRGEPGGEDGRPLQSYDGSPAAATALDRAAATYARERSTAAWWALVAQFEAWRRWMDPNGTWVVLTSTVARRVIGPFAWVRIEAIGTAYVLVANEVDEGAPGTSRHRQIGTLGDDGAWIAEDGTSWSLVHVCNGPPGATLGVIDECRR